MDTLRFNTGRMTPGIVVMVTLNVLQLTWGQGNSNLLTSTSDPFDPFAFSFGEPSNTKIDQTSLDQRIESWASNLLSGNSKILEEIQNSVLSTSPPTVSSSNTNKSNQVHALPEGFNFLSDRNRGSLSHTGSLDNLNQGMNNEFGSLPPIPSIDNINGDLLGTFLPIDSGTNSGSEQTLPSENNTGIHQNMFKLPTIDQLGISADIFDLLPTTPPPLTSPPFVFSKPTSNQPATNRGELLNNLPPIPSLEELGSQGNNNNLLPPDISSKTGQSHSQAGNAVDNIFQPDILSPSTNTGSTNEQGWGNIIDSTVSPQGEAHVGGISTGGLMGNSQGLSDGSQTGNLLDHTLTNNVASQNSSNEQGWGNKFFDSSPNTGFHDSHGGLLPSSTTPIPHISGHEIAIQTTTENFLFGGNILDNSLTTEGHTDSISSGNQGASEVGGFFDTAIGTTSLPLSSTIFDTSGILNNNGITDQPTEIPSHNSLDVGGQTTHKPSQANDPNAQRKRDQEIWNNLIPPLTGNQNSLEEPNTNSIVPSPPPEILNTGGFSDHSSLPDIPTIDQISGTNSNSQDSFQTSGGNSIFNDVLNEHKNTNALFPTNEHLSGGPNVESGGPGNNVNTISNQTINTDRANFNEQSIPANNIQSIGFQRDNMNNNLNSVDNSLFGTQFNQMPTDTGVQSENPNTLGGHNTLGSNNQIFNESPNNNNVHPNTMDGSHFQQPTNNVSPQESNFLFQNSGQNNNISPNELPPIPSIDQISNQEGNFGIPPSEQQSNFNENINNVNTGPTTTPGPLQRMWNELALDSVLNTAVNAGSVQGSNPGNLDQSQPQTSGDFSFLQGINQGTSNRGNNAQNSNTFGFGSSNSLLVDPNTPRRIGDQVSIQVDNQNNRDHTSQTNAIDSGQPTGFTFIDPSSSTVIEAQSNEKFLNFITDPNPPRTGSTFTDIDISPSIGLPLDPFAANANENPIQTLTSNANENQIDPFASNVNTNQIDPFASNANENNVEPSINGEVPSTAISPTDPFAETFPTNSNANNASSNSEVSQTSDMLFDPFAQENTFNPFDFPQNENIGTLANNEIQPTPVSPTETHSSNHNEIQPDIFGLNNNENNLDFLGLNTDPKNILLTINESQPTDVVPTQPAPNDWIPPTAETAVNHIANTNSEHSPLVLFDIRDNQPGNSGQPTSQSIEITPTDRFVQVPRPPSNQGFSNFGSENVVQNVNPPPSPTIAVPSPRILTNNQGGQQFTRLTNNQIFASQNNQNLANRFQSQAQATQFTPRIRQQSPTSPIQNRMTTMTSNVNPNRLFLNPNTAQTNSNSVQNQERQNFANRLQRLRQIALLTQLRNRLQNNNAQNRFQNQQNPSRFTAQGQTQNQNTRFQSTISRFQNTQNTARQQFLRNQQVQNSAQNPAQQRNSFQNLRGQQNSFLNQRGRQNSFQNQARQPNGFQNQARQPNGFQNQARQPNGFQNQARQPNGFQNQARQPNGFQNQVRQQNTVQNQRSQTNNRFQNLSRQQQIRLLQLLRQQQARRQANNNRINLQNRQVQQQTFSNVRGSNVNQNQRLQNTIRNQAARTNSNINRNQLFQSRLQNQASQFTNTNQRPSNQFGRPVNAGGFNNQNVQQQRQINVVNPQLIPRPTPARPPQLPNPALRNPRVLLPLVQLLRARANGQMRNNIPLQRALLQQLLRLRSMMNSNSSSAGGLANQLPRRVPTQLVPVPITPIVQRPEIINEPTLVPIPSTVAAAPRGLLPNRRPFDFASPFQSDRFVDFSLPFERSIEQIMEPTPDALATVAPTPESPPLDLSIPLTTLPPTASPAFELPRINQLRPTRGPILPRGPVAIPISEAFQRIERMRFLSRDSNPFRETAAMNFPFGNANPLQTGVLSLRPVRNFPSVLQNRQRLIVPLTRPSPTRAQTPIQPRFQPPFGDPQRQLGRDGSWSWLGQQVRFLSDQGAL